MIVSFVLSVIAIFLMIISLCFAVTGGAIFNDYERYRKMRLPGAHPENLRRTRNAASFCLLISLGLFIVAVALFVVR